MNMTTRDEVYDVLSRDTLWVRNQTGRVIEDGHTLLYRPTDGILRKQGAWSGHQTVLSIQREQIKLLGLDGAPSVIPRDDILILATALEMTQKRGLGTVLFEGYAIDSTKEGFAQDLALAGELSRRGLKVFHSPSEIHDHWNNKISFREEVRKIYDADAVPQGTEFRAPSIEDLLAFVKSTKGSVILKKPGAGGFGNLLLHEKNGANQPLVTKFLGDGVPWVSAEEWIDWEHTLCCSFFLTDDPRPIHMELCEQVLTEKTRAFVGARSFTSLSQTDQDCLIEMCRPVAKKMQVQGLRGFTAVDVILSPCSGTDELMLPDSALSVRFIEANARLNGHNQEMLFLDQLSRREGVNRDDLVHCRVGTLPVPGAKTRGEVRTFYRKMLADVAVPLSERSLRADELSFVLDVNRGEKWPSIYNAVLFVGRRNGLVVRKIEAAMKLVGSAGLLKS